MKWFRSTFARLALVAMVVLSALGVSTPAHANPSTPIELYDVRVVVIDSSSSRVSWRVRYINPNQDGYTTIAANEAFNSADYISTHYSEVSGMTTTEQYVPAGLGRQVNWDASGSLDPWGFNSIRVSAILTGCHTNVRLRAADYPTTETSSHTIASVNC